MRLPLLLLLLASPLAAEELFLRGATLLPMTDVERLEGHGLHLVEGRIRAILAPTAPAPPGARVIDAKGLFVLPGLCDMHVHNWYAEEHALFLAKGVTTVRNLWGTPMHLRWRKEIEAGGRLGPRLFTSGPSWTGRRSSGRGASRWSPPRRRAAS
ncbi:MAG: hypothetical protein HC813_00325 [Planctomycetes bacterium]|nr:hypothetical protein [Planctomycetota bacterium]